METAIFIRRERANAFAQRLLSDPGSDIVFAEVIPHKRRGAMMGFRVQTLTSLGRHSFVTEDML